MDDDTNDVNALIEEFISLKETNPALSCFMSIGGWDFNSGDTATYWSDMVSTSAGRKSFAKEVLHIMQTYGFDGVDLDWEYPVDSDRGGSASDKANYVLLIYQLRETFSASGQTYGISFTIPSSYWYLQHFDVPAMLKAGADWTNLMSYDLHGVWDGDNPYVLSCLLLPSKKWV
jgi:GH18 family chitinase